MVNKSKVIGASSVNKMLRSGKDYGKAPLKASHTRKAKSSIGSSQSNRKSKSTKNVASTSKHDEIGVPNVKDFALSGTAKVVHMKSPFGLIDIGECDDAYLFRVSLPGVDKDPRKFTCEVEGEGKVILHGETIVEDKFVNRNGEVFEMKTQNFNPPGPFHISFLLPGPVDPQMYSCMFGIDGILEGVVMKGAWPK